MKYSNNYESYWNFLYIYLCSLTPTTSDKRKFLCKHFERNIMLWKSPSNWWPSAVEQALICGQSLSIFQDSLSCTLAMKAAWAEKLLKYRQSTNAFNSSACAQLAAVGQFKYVNTRKMMCLTMLMFIMTVVDAHNPFIHILQLHKENISFRSYITD